MSLALSAALRLATVGAAASLLVGGAAAQWDPIYGTVLTRGDDVLVTAGIPFAFPVPGGGTTNSIRISTNGFIWLNGSSTSSDFSESVSEFLSGDARIAAYWDDLIGGEASGVNAPGLYLKSSASTATVTWLMREYNGATRVQAQAVLNVNGSILVSFAAIGSGDALVGITPGNGATDPGSTDLSAGAMGLGSTVYESFSSGFDMLGQTIAFVPNGGGYNVAAAPSITASGQVDPIGAGRGTGCTVAGIFGDGEIHEAFSSTTTDPCDLVGSSVLYQRLPTGGYNAVLTSSLVWETGFANRIDTMGGIWQGGTGDDSVTVPLALGFTAQYWDNPPTSMIEVASNGRVYLGTGASSTSFSASATTLTQGGSNVALYSRDLDCRSSSITSPTGGLFVDQFPAAGATPAKCVVTFNQVPPWTASPPSSASVSVQAQLFANGNIIVSFLAVDPSLTGITGLFDGGAFLAPSELDFSTALVAPGVIEQPNAPAPPLGHDVDPAILGAVPIARATTLLPGTLASALHVGLDQPSTPLDVIGMPGCTAYTLALIAVLPLAPAGDTATTSLGLIPLAPVLIGNTFTTQALSVVPGANPLQIVASNGWDSTIGRW